MPECGPSEREVIWGELYRLSLVLSDDFDHITSDFITFNVGLDFKAGITKKSVRPVDQQLLTDSGLELAALTINPVQVPVEEGAMVNA